MVKLIPFEIRKFWGKKNFCLVMLLIFFVNLFFLWFLSQPGDFSPGLSDYKKLNQDLSGVNAGQRCEWLAQRHEEIENYSVVAEMLNLRSRSDDFAKRMEKALTEEHPGVFEKYHEKYLSGTYLRYTNSLEKESAMLKGVYGDFQKVENYGDFLKEIAKKKENLSGISIFAADTASFAARNMEKESEDYETMKKITPVAQLATPVSFALEFPVSDLLLYLAVLFFAGALIYEEREKKLFLVTFSSARGRFSTIGAKTGALALHCLMVTFCLYGSDFAWSFASAGFVDLSAPLQSLAPYMESTLKLSIGGFLVFNLLLKALVLFTFGTLLLAAAIAFRQNFMSLLSGGLCLGISGFLYSVIPANSWNNWLKFLNLYGTMKTDRLLGGYLNLNFFGTPVSRLAATLLFLCVVCAGGVFSSIVLFLRGKNLSAAQRKSRAAKLYGEIRRQFGKKMRSLQEEKGLDAYGGLFRHESWKIFIMHRSIVILLLFTVFIGYQHISRPYEISGAESYYQDMMMELSGDLTDEKEAMIEREQARYEKAFAEIERIEGLIAEGEIDQQAGSAMLEPYHRETAFYPAFQKILAQCEWIRQTGDGQFVYDTGYLLLLGFSEGGAADALTDYILLALCMILAFSCTFAMEDQVGAWNVLSATACGKRRIQGAKIKVAMLTGLLITVVIFGCNILQVAMHCPMEHLGASTMNLMPYRSAELDMPLIMWIGIVLLMRILVVMALIMLVLLISAKLKNQLITMCLAGLLLVIPPLLYAMGLDFAKSWSLLPVYQFGTLVA